MFGFGKNQPQVFVVLEKIKISRLSDDDLYALFIQETWGKLSKDSRIAVLQEVENRRARMEGRKPLRIMPGNAPRFQEKPGLRGSHNSSSHTIHINYRMLEEDSAAHSGMAALSTLLHEGRHAFQYHVMDHLQKAVPGLVLKQWQVSKAYYVNGSKGNTESEKALWFTIYQLQPIEMDARRFTRYELVETIDRLERHGLPTEDAQRELSENLEEEIALVCRVKELMSDKMLDDLENLFLQKMKEGFPNMDVSGLKFFEAARMILRADSLDSYEAALKLVLKMDGIALGDLNRISESMRKIKDSVR